jgi:hypothetical protein
MGRELSVTEITLRRAQQRRHTAAHFGAIWQRKRTSRELQRLQTRIERLRR